MGVNLTYWSDHFAIYPYNEWAIMLDAPNQHNVICQLYLNNKQVDD